MYICLCKGVTEKQLIQAALRTNSLKGLVALTKVGTNCGICLTEAKQFLKREKDDDCDRDS